MASLRLTIMAKRTSTRRPTAPPPASARGLTIAPDFEMATRFLSLLEPAGIYTFQTFGDGEFKANKKLNRVFHGTFAQHKDELARLNALGAGIFIMINRGDGTARLGNKTCRTALNVVEVRAIFVDLDGAPLEPLLHCGLPPDVIVESSPRRWHAYWFIRNCPLSEFGPRQQQLAEKFGGTRWCTIYQGSCGSPGSCTRRQRLS
jgi:hypothetical protein